MRIDTLASNNRQTQGAQRRAWLHEHSPQHLEQSAGLILSALHSRPHSTSPNVVVLGAGACTEVPLAELARTSDEVVLVDLDLLSMQRARDELPSTALRKRVRLLERDITGGASANLNRLLEKQSWATIVSEGPEALFDAAAQCLDQCIVLDPPEIEGLAQGEFGLAISSLVLTQLFSYPLLDVLDLVQRVAPQFLGEQERHRRYQEAAQAFRTRIIQAHLHLLRTLADEDGLVVLLSDIRGFAFSVYGSDHDAQHRQAMPLVPRSFFDLVCENFTIQEERHWEWISDLPEGERPGRGYEVVGYVLMPLPASRTGIV